MNQEMFLRAVRWNGKSNFKRMKINTFEILDLEFVHFFLVKRNMISIYISVLDLRRHKSRPRWLEFLDSAT